MKNDFLHSTEIVFARSKRNRPVMTPSADGASLASKVLMQLPFFSRILLRYTFLNSEEYEAILERLVERLQGNGDPGLNIFGHSHLCVYFTLVSTFKFNTGVPN